MRLTGKLSRSARPAGQKCYGSVAKVKQYGISKLTMWKVLKNKWVNVIFYNGKM